MASKRKQDDKHLKILREMVAKEHNKTCFDCHQRGPTYVNMKIGSFVCTSCSGILRGINPPHRVKSISMASYTPEEIEFLQNHGNEVCRQIWLGLYDSKSRAEPESKEEQKVKDFMMQKYERKRWYVEPSQAAAVAIQRAKELKQKEELAASKSCPEPKPLKSLISEPPKLVVGRQNKSSPNRKPLASIATPPASTQTPAAVAKPSTDLLADLGGDPFGGVSTGGGNAAGFADFGAAFGGAPSPFGVQSTQSFTTPSTQQPSQPNAAVAAFMQQSQGTGNNQGGFASFPPTSSAAQTNINQTSQNLQNLSITQPAGDKYAALSNLLESGTNTEASINWGGASSSGSIDWGVSSNSSNTSLGSSKSTPPTMVGVPGVNASKFGVAQQGVFGTPPSSNAFGVPPTTAAFGNQPGMNAFVAQPQTNSFGVQPGNVFMSTANAFGVTPANNAFGSVPTSNAFGAAPVNNAFGSSPNTFGTQKPTVNNPFAGAPAQSAASNPFLGMGSAGQMPQSNGMYGGGGASATPGGQPAGFGQFGVGQTSQFGIPTQVNGNFGVIPQQTPTTMSFGGAGMTAMAANQFAKPAQPSGFGQQAFGGTAGAPVPAGGAFSTWNNQPQANPTASNPFMGGAFMAQAAAPKPQGSSNNPFL